MNLDKASAYVQQHGSIVEQAQLHYILTNSPVSLEIIELFFADQHSDGSWSPFWTPEASSIDATCYHLIQAEYLGLLTPLHPTLERTITFLREKQMMEGYWEEDARLHEVAPPWARPVDLAATLYLTANCGFCLACLVRTGEPAQAASTYLLHYLAHDSTLPSFAQTQWLAASLWYYLGQFEPASRIFSSLQQRLAGEVPAGNLMWMINSLRDAGISVTHPLLTTAATLLEKCQREDGSWRSDDSSMFDVRTTIEAVRALRLNY